LAAAAPTRGRRRVTEELPAKLDVARTVVHGRKATFSKGVAQDHVAIWRSGERRDAAWQGVAIGRDIAHRPVDRTALPVVLGLLASLLQALARSGRARATEADAVCSGQPLALGDDALLVRIVAVGGEDRLVGGCQTVVK